MIEILEKEILVCLIMIDRFLVNAYESAEDYKSARADALVNTSFEGLPPCLFIVAELDPLRDANLRK